MQFQADISGAAVERPAMLEVTALGAAVLAGLATGFWRDRSELDAGAGALTVFEPTLGEATREALHNEWKRAVERSRDWARD